jgi:hypothetical protein
MGRPTRGKLLEAKIILLNYFVPCLIFLYPEIPFKIGIAAKEGSNLTIFLDLSLHYVTKYLK